MDISFCPKGIDETHLCYGIRGLAFQETDEDISDRLCLLRVDDRLSVLTLVVSEEGAVAHRVFPFLEPPLHSPGNVLRYGPGLLLAMDDMIVSSISPLLSKVQMFSFSKYTSTLLSFISLIMDRLFHCVPRKPGNGFGENNVNFLILNRIINHSEKSFTLLRMSTRYPLINIDL